MSKEVLDHWRYFCSSHFSSVVSVNHGLEMFWTNAVGVDEEYAPCIVAVHGALIIAVECQRVHKHNEPAVLQNWNVSNTLFGYGYGQMHFCSFVFLPESVLGNAVTVLPFVGC